MIDDNENVQELDSVEVLKSESAISQVTRAEIDTQITTAKAYPRSIKKFLDKAMSIATATEEIAEKCAYVLPRAGKNLEGPSVRLAEIVIGAYTNVRAGMRVIHNDGITITAQGVCHDLETNTCITLEVKRSILQNEWKNGQKTGRRVTMSEDMQVVTGNAACAIAFRNAVFKIIPAALIEDVYEKVKEVARGTAETLPARRAKALAYVRGLGVKDEQIAKALGLQSVEDIDLDKLAILRGMCTAIKTNEATVDEVFPKNEPKAKAQAATDATTEAIKKATEKATGKTKKEDKEPGDMPA